MEELQTPRYPNNTIINVTNFGDNMTNDRLKKMFEKYGTITSYGILNDDKPWCRFGHVAFEDSDAADEAVIEMNGQSFDDNRRIRVRRTTKRERREKPKITVVEGEKKIDEARVPVAGASAARICPTENDFLNRAQRAYKIGHCVYVKNLDRRIDRVKLREAFQAFGRILEAKVITDNTGWAPQSRGYGFVTFVREEDAERAIREKNGRLIGTQIVRVEMSRGPRWLRTDEALNNAPPELLRKYFRVKAPIEDD